MILRSAIIAMAVACLFITAACAQTLPRDHPFSGLDTRTRDWPGLMAPAERRRLEPAAKALLEAMRAHDARAIAKRRDELVTAMGRYAGEPEEQPLYGVPLDTSEPALQRVLTTWNEFAREQHDNHGWRLAPQRVAQGQSPDRLRTSLRVARANLQLYDAAVPDADEHLREARSAFDYMLTTQAANGVFGYPYDSNARAGLRSEAARFAAEAQRRGRDVVENGWIIDDLGTGALNFDNGVVGAGLLHVWLATGDERYFAAARRAGEWAMDRPYVGNFNYNGFNGLILARLYRVSGEARYLSRAREIFDYSVLPGQLPNGRWFDQHNAKIQYHAILLSQLIEYWLALRQAHDEVAARRVKDAVIRGLDNLATEIQSFGSSNPHEMLALETLAIGSLVFGDRPAWTLAMNIEVNYLLDVFAPKLAKGNRPLPETLTAYVLWRKGPGPHATGADYEVGPLQPRVH